MDWRLGFGGRRSGGRTGFAESYGPKGGRGIERRNAPCRTRTCDRRIRNPLLYPAELRAQFKSQLRLSYYVPGEQGRQGDLQLGGTTRRTCESRVRSIKLTSAEENTGESAWLLLVLLIMRFRDESREELLPGQSYGERFPGHQLPAGEGRSQGTDLVQSLTTKRGGQSSRRPSLCACSNASVQS